jgi:hypothetical protein
MVWLPHMPKFLYVSRSIIPAGYGSFIFSLNGAYIALGHFQMELTSRLDIFNRQSQPCLLSPIGIQASLVCVEDNNFELALVVFPNNLGVAEERELETNILHLAPRPLPPFNFSLTVSFLYPQQDSASLASSPLMQHRFLVPR